MPRGKERKYFRVQLTDEIIELFEKEKINLSEEVIVRASILMFKKINNLIENGNIIKIIDKQGNESILNISYKEFSFRNCSKCKCEKKLNNFRWLKSTNCYCSICKNCEYINNRKYYKENREKCLKLEKEWRKKNKDRTRTIARKNTNQYYLEHKEQSKIYKKEYSQRPEVIERRREWNKNKRKNDIAYRLRSNVSRAINEHLKLFGSGKKGRSSWKHLPYSPQDLIKHLESLFEPWMNWNNHGIYKNGEEKKWHIDHIIPHSKFKYTSMEDEEFKKCWALENLRPLEAVENISKGNRK